MGTALRLSALSLLFGVIACTQPPSAIAPAGQDAGRAGVAPESREIQQVQYPWYWRYGSRWQNRYTRRGAAACQSAYSDCITRDQKANPGAPGQLFGGSTAGREACQRALDACYQRSGVPTSEPRVN